MPADLHLRRTKAEKTSKGIVVVGELTVYPKSRQEAPELTWGLQSGADTTDVAWTGMPEGYLRREWEPGWATKKKDPNSGRMVRDKVTKELTWRFNWISVPLPRTPKVYRTIENLGEKGDMTWARKGDYDLVMSFKNTSRIIPCFRFTPRNLIGTILIHDFGGDLLGCIAPGMPDGSTGIRQTTMQDAMAEILELLGGFKDEEPVTLQIENNPPGKNQDATREEWLRDR